MENLIIYGGAFDPVHNGHLRIAEAASLRLNADVVFVPTHKPRWKEASASDEDRVKMLKIALRKAKNPSFTISLCEMERNEDETYTIDTLHYFQKKYPDRQLVLLIGTDQVNAFPKWKNADEIASIANIVYVDRPGYEPDKAVVKKYKMKSLGFSESGEVSSTSIRELRYLDLPGAILDYISSHHLYYMKTLETYLDGRRLEHSISVAELAYAIAYRNHIPNPGRAYIAGLLHDVAKRLPDEKARAIMKEKFSDYRKIPTFVWHQFTGAKVVEDVFKIDDPTVLDAIEFHCTGRAEMDEIAMIIYAADKIEPTRGWDSARFIKMCLADYEKGFIEVLRANREFLTKKGSDPNSISWTRECFEYYLGGNADGLSKKS